jgi:hypothetical protein
VQSSELFPVLAIALSVTAAAGLIAVGLMLRNYRRNQRIIMGSRGTVDVAEHMAIVDDKLTNLRLAVEDLTLTARDHGVRIDGTLSHVGIVRFDAYRDLGGRQSTAVALVNSRNDGVVITAVVSRDFARMYVKLIKDGVGDIALAPEENEAVQQAHSATPFVVKPLSEGEIGEEEMPEEYAELGEGEAITAGLGGAYEDPDEEARSLERENRRRRRKGLPPIKPAVAAPSVGGWGAPETPAAVASMAEQFVQQRRKGRGREAEPQEQETRPIATPDDNVWPAPPDDDGGWTSPARDDEWGFGVPDDDTHEM